MLSWTAMTYQTYLVDFIPIINAQTYIKVTASSANPQSSTGDDYATTSAASSRREDELDDKLGKLVKFYDTDIYAKLDEASACG